LVVSTYSGRQPDGSSRYHSGRRCRSSDASLGSGRVHLRTPQRRHMLPPADPCPNSRDGAHRGHRTFTKHGADTVTHPCFDDDRRQSTTIDDNRRQSTTTPDLSPVGSLRCDPCILCIDARSTSLYNNLFSVNSNNSSKKCCLLSSLSSPWLVCVSSDARADFPPWICCSRFLRVAFSTFAVASARRTTMKDRIFVADRSETFVFLSESATYLIPEVAEFTPTRSSNSPHSHALSVL
jgi:hypothetical protein